MLAVSDHACQTAPDISCLTADEVSSSLGVAKPIWIGRRKLPPVPVSPLSDLQSQS